MTVARKPAQAPVPPREIVDNATVRAMCGGVTRHSLILWRKKFGFPEPLKTRTAIEVWDAREVRAWWKARR